METEIVVGARGRITIPARVRKKYGLEGRVKIVETEEGFLMLSKKELWISFWNLIDTNSTHLASDK